MSHLVADPNCALEVQLVEYRNATRSSRTTGVPGKGDRHLAIGWVVGYQNNNPTWVFLHIVQESDIPHLTNWGPITQAEGDSTRSAAKYSLGQHSLQTRQRLKNIAAAMPVQVPDGHYNCQNWVRHVLDAAVAQQVLSAAAVHAAWTAFLSAP